MRRKPAANVNADEWKSAQHALAYPKNADRIPRKTEGERVLLDHTPLDAGRVLELGAGDGRLLALLRIDRPRFEGVALDFLETMLSAARLRFKSDGRIKIVRHDLNLPLPSSLGRFDAIVSSFVSITAHIFASVSSIEKYSTTYPRRGLL